jgi:hypothetical protein
MAFIDLPAHHPQPLCDSVIGQTILEMHPGPVINYIAVKLPKTKNFSTILEQLCSVRKSPLAKLY